MNKRRSGKVCPCSPASGSGGTYKSGLVFFFGKSKLHQAIQGQLQMFHSRVDLELRGFFFVSGHASGETHLYIKGQLATKISEFRRAALRCMDENRSFLQQHKPDGNPAA